MSATEAIAAVENLAVRAIRADNLLRDVDQQATPDADGMFFQVPADALAQIRAYLHGN